MPGGVVGLFDRLLGKPPEDAGEQFYAQALAEFNEGIRREGLWAKAWSATTNEREAEGLYIKLRALSLQDEARLLDAEIMAIRRAEEAAAAAAAAQAEAKAERARYELQVRIDMVEARTFRGRVKRITLALFGLAILVGVIIVGVYLYTGRNEASVREAVARENYLAAKEVGISKKECGTYYVDGSIGCPDSVIDKYYPKLSADQIERLKAAEPVNLLEKLLVYYLGAS